MSTKEAAGLSGRSVRGPSRIAGALGGCAKNFDLFYEHGYKKKVEPDFRMLGSIGHDCLAYHYGEKINPTPEFLNISLDERLAHRTRYQPNGPELIATAKQVVDAYKRRFQNEAWTPLFIETEFLTTVGEIDPGGPYPELDSEVVSCRSDLIVEGNGRNWIVDYKFMAGEWGRSNLNVWSAATEREYLHQAFQNLLVVRKTMPIEGFIIRRAKRKAPYDFDQQVLTINDRQYNAMPRMIRYAVKRDLELQALAVKGEAQPNFAVCMGKYGPCDYTAYCHADTEIEAKEILQEDYYQ